MPPAWPNLARAGVGSGGARAGYGSAEDRHGEVGVGVPGAQVPRGEAVLDAQAGIDDRLIEVGEGEVAVRVEAGDDEAVGR